MDTSTKNRLLGTLVAVTAIYAAVTVIVFFTTGEFGSVWFGSSLALYTVVAVAGVGLTLLAEEAKPEAQAASGEHPGPSKTDRLRHEKTATVYETPTGRVLRAFFSNGDTSQEVVFAVTPHEVLPAEDLARRLDALEVEADEAISDEAIERALTRQRDRSPKPGVDPAEVAVVLLDRRPLYEASTGRAVRARWRTPLGDREGVFVVTDEQAIPVQAVERRLDRLDEAPTVLGDEEEIRSALESHQIDEPADMQRTEDVIQP